MVFRKRSQPPPRLFDPTKIDLVGVVDGAVELHIVRDSAWTGTDEELRSFQDKVHAYVGYALDGQMAAAYPETAGLPWVIVVDSTAGSPDGRSSELLEATKAPVSKHGGGLEVRIL